MASLIRRACRKLLTPVLWDYTSADMQCGNLSFSQFGEDVLMKYLFQSNYIGLYVDVGAYHPMTLSNTYSLYRQGWRGIAIDPNPDCGKLFARFRPEDVFLQSAVGMGATSVEMAMFKEATFNCTADQVDQVPEKVRRDSRLLKVPLRSLSEIFASNGIQKIDLLSVDCEGNDLNVLRSNEWSRWKPSVICVEDHVENWARSETALFLDALGYSLKYRVGFSSIFALHASHSESREWNDAV
jgi:FkbM family methyltransferase